MTWIYKRSYTAYIGSTTYNFSDPAISKHLETSNMQLRKRLWAELEAADSPKPISLPQEPNHPQIHTLLGYISKAHIFNTAHNVHNVKTKLCVLKDVACCAMTTLCCCACADKRPNALRFQYVEGTGVGKGVRWQSYCPGCKGIRQISSDEAIH
jgi:hypothetical protein